MLYLVLFLAVCFVLFAVGSYFVLKAVKVPNALKDIKIPKRPKKLNTGVYKAKIYIPDVPNSNGIIVSKEDLKKAVEDFNSMPRFGVIGTLYEPEKCDETGTHAVKLEYDDGVWCYIKPLKNAAGKALAKKLNTGFDYYAFPTATGEFINEAEKTFRITKINYVNVTNAGSVDFGDCTDRFTLKETESMP